MIVCLQSFGRIIANILCVQIFNQKAPNIILISTLLKKLKKIHRKQVINNVHIPFFDIPCRVGNGISFRKNSAELTRSGFRYSAEESPHSEAFRVPRKNLFRSSERNGTEWNSAVKISFMKQQQNNLTK